MILVIFIMIVVFKFQTFNFKPTHKGRKEIAPILFPSPCNNTGGNSRAIYLKYLETKSLPPRSFFKNTLNFNETNFHRVPKNFSFNGQIYLTNKKKLGEGGNKGVFKYKSTTSNHTLFVKTGMSELELLLTTIVHQSNFAGRIFFLGPNFMITESFGETVGKNGFGRLVQWREFKNNFTKNEQKCINFLMVEIMDIIHEEYSIFHCDLHYLNIVMNKNFKLTIIDWGIRSQYIPGNAHFPRDSKCRWKALVKKFQNI